MDPVIILTIIFILLCFLALSWFAGSDAPYIPTKYSKLKNILKIAGAKKGITFYELGSGDGRVVLEAARLGAQSYGIEQSWLRVLYSKYQAKKLNFPNAHFIHGNVFKRDYQKADIVFIYLLPKAVSTLEEKLIRELKKGSQIITQTYHLPHLKPIREIDNFQIYRI